MRTLKKLALVAVMLVGSSACGGDSGEAMSKDALADLAADIEAEIEDDIAVEDLVVDAQWDAAIDVALDSGEEVAADAFEDAIADATADSDLQLPKTCVPTTGDAQGPYYLEGAPFVDSIAGPDEPGERLLLHGRVVDEACDGVSGAVLDFWQTDADGNYPGGEEGWRLRGRIQADADGSYAVITVLPGFYEGRPRHVHVKVSGPGFELVTTQLYFEGDPFLWPEDSCGPPTCHSDDPARILSLTDAAPATGADLAAEMQFVLSASQ